MTNSPLMQSVPKLPKCGHKALGAASNLANLLPTGTVLIFQALVPSFSNNGVCELANKYLTLGLIICCSLACFLSSFTDSFIGKDGQVYYGIATLKGLHVLNDTDSSDGYGAEELNQTDSSDGNGTKECNKTDPMKKYRINLIDFLHAFGSLTVFLVFALSSSEVQNCLFPKPGPNEKALIMNLPLGAGLLASFVFMIFPTRRRGIGYGDTQHHEEHH